MLETIQLPNGKTISWDDFCELPEKEQERITKELNVISDKQWSIDAAANALPTRKEFLPRIRAAAERNAITEDDLLAFIKVVHDIFFPPQPMQNLKPHEELPGKAKRTNVKGAFMSMSKPVRTPVGDFPSMAAAGRYYSVEGSRIRAWIKNGKEGYAYI